MLETTYLKCAACFHSWPVDTPKENAELRKIVSENSTCRCGCTIILQAAYSCHKERVWKNNTTTRKGSVQSGYAAKSV